MNRQTCKLLAFGFIVGAGLGITFPHCPTPIICEPELPCPECEGPIEPTPIPHP